MPPMMQLPSYQINNALLDYAPLNAGVDAYRKGQEDVRRFGVAQEAGNALMNKDYSGAMSTALKGDRADLAGLAMHAQSNASQMETAALDREAKMAQLYGGVAQQVLALHAKGDQAGARALYGRITSNPKMNDALVAHGVDPRDHVGTSQFLVAQAAGYRDPLEQESKRAQIGLSNAHAGYFQSQADAGKFMSVQPGASLYDTKQKQFVNDPTSGDGLEAVGAKEFAKEAPKLIQKTAQEHNDANNMSTTLADLKALAPYATTGFGADQILMLRKMAAQAGFQAHASIEPTEMFRALSQEGILQAAQKLKPLSNSDVAFVEKGLVTIKTDPTSAPAIIEGFDAIAKRTALAKRLELQSLRKYRQPDYVAIQEAVDAAIPSPIQKRYGVGTQPPASTGNLPTKPVATHAAPVKVNTPEEAMRLPPGTTFQTPDGRLKVR